MTNPLRELADLRRPRLMIRAARLGVDDYRRDRDLRRLLGVNLMPAPAEALPALLAAEAEVETVRRDRGRNYSIARHVELLIAMLAEARLLRSLG